MQERIFPARQVSGSICLPGDKSISHRYAILGALADGVTHLANFSTGADCHSTLGALRALGVTVEEQGSAVTIYGRGLDGFARPSTDLDAGNSGSTIRMLAGVLAAQPFSTRIAGDESLSRRPMDRIMKPLAAMGAVVRARDGRFPPLEIEGGHELRPIDYSLPIPSAQVKTCILLGGLYCNGRTVMREPLRSRDHTEIALREFGADITVARNAITLAGRPKLAARDLVVPADLSSAAFFIVAALLLPGSSLSIRGVGLNPTRATLLDFLVSAGADIRILDVSQQNGELIGDILVKSSRIRGGVIEKETTAALIDEIPALAVLGAVSAEGLTVRDASELRVKETDRIATIVRNLRRMEIEVQEFPDGFAVPGNQRFCAAELDSCGDHRIAMAFAIAALAADAPSQIRGAESASISFPEFFTILRQVTA